MTDLVTYQAPDVKRLESSSQAFSEQIGALRLCTVMASLTGFRQVAANPTRTVLGLEILAWAASLGARAIAFPAGFLRGRSDGEQSAHEAALPILAGAWDRRIAAVVGVDACDPDWEAKAPRDKLVASGALPYFSATVATDNPIATVHRQRSTNTSNWRFAPRGIGAQVRWIRAGTTPVATLLGGDLFSAPLCRFLGSVRPKAALVPTHWASSMWREPQSLAKLGLADVPIVRAAHVRALGWIGGIWKGRAPVEPLAGPVRFQHGDIVADAVIIEL